MKELDALLAIADLNKRQSALVQYAKALGLNPRLAAGENGELNEEKLIIMIYDALQEQRTERKKDVNFVGIGIFYLVVMIAIMAVLPRIIKMFGETKEAELNVESQSYVGVDSKGKPVEEGKEAAYYKLMDGLYEEYYDDGTLHYEYKYVNGKLVRQKEFNPQGELINVSNFK